MSPASKLDRSASPPGEMSLTTGRCIRGGKRIRLVHSTPSSQDDSHNHRRFSSLSKKRTRRRGSVSPRMAQANSIPCWARSEASCASAHGDGRRNLRRRRGYGATRERFGGCRRHLGCRRGPGRGGDVSRSETCHEPTGGSTRGTGAGPTRDARRVRECDARRTTGLDDGRGRHEHTKTAAMR